MNAMNIEHPISNDDILIAEISSSERAYAVLSNNTKEKWTLSVGTHTCVSHIAQVQSNQSYGLRWSQLSQQGVEHKVSRKKCQLRWRTPSGGGYRAQSGDAKLNATQDGLKRDMRLLLYRSKNNG